MACTISADEIKRVKALGFLNNKGTDLFNGRVITVNGNHSSTGKSNRRGSRKIW